MEGQKGHHRCTQMKHKPQKQKSKKSRSKSKQRQRAEPGSTKAEILFREVEKMPLWQLQSEAAEAGLKQSGTESQLIRRLKAHYRGSLIKTRTWIAKNHPEHRTTLYYDYLVAIDFECTCEENLYDFDNEIIEFPAVLIDVKERRIKSQFRTFVKPLQTEKISLFCSKLTGITQEEIEKAPKFPDALRAFRTWMRTNGIDTDNKRYAYVTDGPWDIARFFQKECHRHGMKIPHDFRVFVNLRRSFVKSYRKDEHAHVRSGRPPPTISNMLSHFGTAFDGNEHSGIDDAMNLARIVIAMLNDKMEIRVNEKLVVKELLRPWQREVFHERRNSGVEEGGNVEKPKENNPMEENAINGEDMEKSKDDNTCTSDIAMKNDFRPEKPKWLSELPYTLVLISRPQYFGEQYLDCESCSDGEGDEEEEEQEDFGGINGETENNEEVGSQEMPKIEME